MAGSVSAGIRSDRRLGGSGHALIVGSGLAPLYQAPIGRPGPAVGPSGDGLLGAAEPMPLASVTSACRARCTRGPARAASNGRTGCTSTIWWCIRGWRTRALPRRFGWPSGARGRGPRGRRIPLTSSLPPRGRPVWLEFPGSPGVRTVPGPGSFPGQDGRNAEDGGCEPSVLREPLDQGFRPLGHLYDPGGEPHALPEGHGPLVGGEGLQLDPLNPHLAREPGGLLDQGPAHAPPPVPGPDHDPGELQGPLVGEPRGDTNLAVRSEEHTSELQ